MYIVKLEFLLQNLNGFCYSTKCLEKSVKRAYCIVCDGCCKKLQLCAKCGGQKDIVARYVNYASFTNYANYVGKLCM